jgi:hypothetical protein
VRWTSSIKVGYVSDQAAHFDSLADGHAPSLEFTRFEDLVAYLERVAEATGDVAVGEFAAEVKRESAVVDRVSRVWGKKRQVTLADEIGKALVASNKPRKTPSASSG